MMPAQENNCAKQDSIELFNVIVAQAESLKMWKIWNLPLMI